MDKDLARRQSYYVLLLTLGLGIVIVSIIHQSTMDIAMNADNFGPFILTTSVWGLFFLSIMFAFNKFRYVTTTTDQKLRIGNLLSSIDVTFDKVAIIGKTFGPVYRITVDQKIYYILSSEDKIDAFKGRTG